ncbi:virulence factor BrkB family protein [Pseudoalteromonas ruthenica]|uniref:virulence factor BrkB family protein n=1 Tax=Pseudoalteromonas ruthenica TaxID=151081 RepID=UPI0005FA0DD5|nr:virulence factor BrkB family protein [Pseudoalteromonas ruthenica]TMO85989.1 YihY/virulence factor BrkB family protein [Pseudoalteromonas ruthenica]TMO93621.1 YihY/virulence factor BrkB family protein [Pseudoalteromonas ruthenica]TMO97675.1 YihY/virulence factor BrkB family protein [Pseudoalteromonas ruthenica]TMP10003.1 YihY/virulence factor BrkB family protein [Pseudoalteromonas ruthenica]TMP11299.1 YihY/virulence factor BrkB family protein [Pseudoalteromonas ruthenica]
MQFNGEKIKAQLSIWVKAQPRWWRYFFTRCMEDQITVNAGYLAYVTLLSLVPLIAVGVAIFSAFPGFEDTRIAIESFIFNNMVPTSTDVIKEHIGAFTGNANKMTAVGVSFLAVVALFLIRNIDLTLNRIWRIKKKRPAVISFAIYWMVLSLGPVLLGLSIGATSYIVSLVSFADGGIPGFSGFVLKSLPYVISTVGFVMLYTLVPNTRVPFRAAVPGAIFAALLFELTKKGFAMYISHFPSYEVIYGALATVPILFVWVYLSWAVVLLGAEFTVCISVSKPPIDDIVAEEKRALEE